MAGRKLLDTDWTKPKAIQKARQIQLPDAVVVLVLFPLADLVLVDSFDCCHDSFRRAAARVGARRP